MKLPSSLRLVLNLTNRTGAASVKGQLVMIDGTYDDSYSIAEAGGAKAAGVVLVAGIPDGQLVPICTRGKCQVLFATDMAAGVGTWATLDPDENGRAGYPDPSPATAQGIGMPLENGSVGGLAWCVVSFSRSSDIVGAVGGG